MTTTKTYDFLNRLQSISSAAASTVSAAYKYNSANQRTENTQPDSSFWLYQYDPLGQVASGKKYWSDWTPVAGQQFEYVFDDIGNRTSTKAGGDSTGANLRSATYTANNLNQYTSRDVPGTMDIIGVANAAATATVNAQSTYRKVEYYQKALAIANSATNVWQSVTNQAVLAAATNTTTGNVFLPKTPESFGYDADGNQTNDGRWMLTWDAENRLAAAESQTTAPTASKRKVAFVFDWQGRMTRRTEYDGSSGSYVRSRDETYVYDALRCLAELNATNNTVVRSFLWGLDLSGTVTGAGGVGGLVSMSSAANGEQFYAMDGNGNMTALVTATNGAVSANYEYDPFGQTIRITGTPAKDNPSRFSTKRWDDALDIVLFEKRPYKPTPGNWLSRDPIGERGGINLYQFVLNNPLNAVDPLGAFTIDANTCAQVGAYLKGNALIMDYIERSIKNADNIGWVDYQNGLKALGGTDLGIMVLGDVGSATRGAGITEAVNAAERDVGLATGRVLGFGGGLVLDGTALVFTLGQRAPNLAIRGYLAGEWAVHGSFNLKLKDIQKECEKRCLKK